MIFENWFKLSSLSAGDWPFLFKETIESFSYLPEFRQGGYFPLDFFYQLTAKVLNTLGFPWTVIERLVWFWPFLILTVFSSWHLAQNIFPKNKITQIFSPLFYLFNTYILMIVGGGQMGVAMAYSIAPLILAKFITGSPIFAGLLLAVQIMFDPRISLITLLATFIYFLLLHKWEPKLYFKNLLLPVIISLGLHLIWIIPVMISRTAFLPESYQQSGWLDFLSVAEFSKTLSLLHPNWPENIFGKTCLMRPEFLILPILAYSSLLFINSVKGLTSSRVKNPLINNSLINNKIIIYFALLGLIGAFLAKGSNPPLGEIYIWLFKYFPGMKMFRDSSKFYTLVVLSYSILIPYSLKEIYLRIKR